MGCRSASYAVPLSSKLPLGVSFVLFFWPAKITTTLFPAAVFQGLTANMMIYLVVKETDIFKRYQNKAEKRENTGSRFMARPLTQQN